MLCPLVRICLPALGDLRNLHSIHCSSIPVLCRISWDFALCTSKFIFSKDLKRPCYRFLKPLLYGSLLSVTLLHSIHFSSPHLQCGLAKFSDMLCSIWAPPPRTGTWKVPTGGAPWQLQGSFQVFVPKDYSPMLPVVQFLKAIVSCILSIFIVI